MNKPTLIPLSDRQEQAEVIANSISQSLADALGARPRASLAVSGGSTPEAMFQLLGAKALAWQNIDCLLVDERWLPDGHADRNDSLLKRSLLDGPASACRYLAMKTHHSSPKDGQFYLDQQLAELDWPLDVIHLGMGDDGHTASWFHDAPEYEDLQHSIEQHCMAVHPGAAPYERISLTPAAVFNSRRIIVQITGQRKREVLDAALAGDSSYPIEMVLHQNNVPVEIYWAP